jgi:hypothetical protein
MPTYNPDAKAPTFELVRGDYPFEIEAVEKGISKGAKTGGSTTHKLTLAVYRDASFTDKIATVKNSNSATLIDHPSTDWKYSVFAKCVNAPVKAGQSLDPNDSWIGLRGHAKFLPEPDKADPKKEWNAVAVFYTDKPALPKRKMEEEPF